MPRSKAAKTPTDHFYYSEPINERLREHALAVEDWPHREVVQLLHEWADRFNSTFNLGLPTAVMRIDRTRGHLGQYRRGRNGFGMTHEITLALTHLHEPLFEQLATLLHEQLHAWQYLYGKPGSGNYHNRQFQNKARLYGLIVDDRGHHLGIEPGRFSSILMEHGVELQTSVVGDLQLLSRPHDHDKSKMRKWACGCTTVRCAVTLVAKCLKCGVVFEEAASAW
jgi:hypothetical protein